MSEDTADVKAPTGSDFTLSLDSGTIKSASLNQKGTSRPLTVIPPRAVKVTNTPAGDSFVSMAMVWAPGDDSATVSVTPPAESADPPRVIDAGDNPGRVTIWGKTKGIPK